MFRMEIDTPPDSPAPRGSSLSPTDRIIERLALMGVPRKNLEQLQPGLVNYMKDCEVQTSELVSAILPTDEDVVETVLETRVDSAEDVGGPSLKNEFHESLLWLQWLMFEGEPHSALNNLAKLNVGERGVCGAVWGNNDIAYRCRTCEHDPTCAICVPCFQNGNHKDHDYSIIYTGGGCCDCGDATAWKRSGFCSKHKGAEKIQSLPEKFATSVGPVLDSLLLHLKNKLLLMETQSQDSLMIDDRVAVLKKVVDELASAMVEMLLEFCKCSESLLSFISGRMFSTFGLLDILVRAERFLSKDVVKKLHELLLKLLGEPHFKYEFAKVFISYYPSVVSEAIKECNGSIFEKYPLLSTFSVQILTVPTLTPRLVNEMNLLAMLLECLGEIFISCADEDGRLQVNKWGNLYETTIRVVEDIRFVMSHSIVPKYVTRDRRDILRTWMRLLTFVQGMSPLQRETDAHVEDENEYMNLPFIFGYSIANIHSLIVSGAFSIGSDEVTDDETCFNTYKQDFEDQDNERHAKVGRLSQESSVCGVTGRSGALNCSLKTADINYDNYPVLSSVLWLTYECLRAVEIWLGMDNTSGPLPGVLLPKTGDVSGNNLFMLRRTLSMIKKSRCSFKSNAASSNNKPECSDEGHGREFFSPGHNNSPSRADMQSGRSMGQDSGHASHDDSLVEGEHGIESEALCVLSLSDWPEIIYDVSSQEVSLHIPLHRLLSLVLQRALRRCYGESASLNKTSASADSLSALCHDFFSHVLRGCHPYGFSAFVMEHPLRIRVFCAEVRAGMWRKNGDAALLSWEWYRSVRCYEQGLELDLFLLQCCAALAPADHYLNRIVERFGLSNYLALNLEGASEYEPVLVHEMLTLMIQIVKERRFSGLNTAECLQQELIYKLSTGDATHSQLVKSLPRDLCKVDMLQDILDTVALYSNPSGMNQGMYKLRPAYWKELDLYHPRWNSRDLQVAEERYMHFCHASALTSQLPRWTRIYHPLIGIARIATCKVALQIVQAVLFYAIFTDKLTVSRAPDGVLLSALHFLSLSLDICDVQRESGDRSCYINDVIPILAFAGEETCMGTNTGCGEQSLLSLLVLLMRTHKRENAENFVEPGSFNLCSLIENLLKKFAELDSGCMEKLLQLAPEVVNQLSQSMTNNDMDMMGSASIGDRRKAKSRERQAAILEKMRAQQSKFLAIITSNTEDESDVTKIMQEMSPSESSHDLGESSQIICSLCHDPNSKSPLAFLTLLQKSRLLRFVDQGPPPWEPICRSEMEKANMQSVSFQRSVLSSCSDVAPSSQLTRLIQNSIDVSASDGQPREINNFLELIRARFPSVSNVQPPCSSNNTREKTAPTFETLEEHMYLLIREGVNDMLLRSGDLIDDSKLSTDEGGRGGGDAESRLLGKYIAALSKEAFEKPSASDSVHSRTDRVQRDFTSLTPDSDGFGPSDCDGIHVSSCGHAVHQGCLDRYLSSLKERYNRRIVFEGGHIVDPDKGELLCPVCRGLANAVLPAFPGDSKKLGRPPKISATTYPFASSDKGFASLRVRQALSLLQTAADFAGRNEILNVFPMQKSGRMKSNLESVSRMLCGMYFPGKNNIAGSDRVCHSMILWDTLKYSLMTTEIAARSRRDSLTPNYGFDALYKEFKPSSGFVLSLLLKLVQSTRSKNTLSVLLRLRGLQLFAVSISSGVSLDAFPSPTGRLGGNVQCILENGGMELRYPDIQFWTRASDPILSRDAFSSLMWTLFCLPSSFLSCEESFLSLVHLFYVVSMTQAIMTYCRKHPYNIVELAYDNCLITDICKLVEQRRLQYFVSNYIDPSHDIKQTIRRLSFPYLRRCALLWKLINTSTLSLYSDTSHLLESASYATDNGRECGNIYVEEFAEVEDLEKKFKIPPLDDIVHNEHLRSLVSKWFLHLCKEIELHPVKCLLHITPVVPFRLMTLPHLYQDLLQRYIKQHCPDCGKVQVEPALCLFCGKLCSPSWKICCRERGCQTHAMACGAGTGVFLLIRRTTILLQRCARQAPWPSLYLDAFGEEDLEMQRGKPLYLNEERYAALNQMVASHGIDRSSKVLRQTTLGSFFML